jgi:N-acyl-D-amino-acid deacylase
MSEVYDVLISNVLIFDGTGSEPYLGDVGVIADRIALVTHGASGVAADQVIDATGLHLTPGFIDTHASTGFGFFFPHAADHKLYQGITTEIFGNCGTSPAPIGPGLEKTMHGLADDLSFTYDWSSIAEYYQRLETIGLQFNVASLVGHSTLRGGVLADWNQVSDGEQQQMNGFMEDAMQEGALGLSTGLIYAPGCFAETEEIIALAKIAANNGGVYASHMRDERDKLAEAVEETLEIGHKAGINVLISHLKAAEKQNFGKISAVLERLDQFNATEPTEAKIDVYPYTAVSTKVRAFIPKYLLDAGIDQLPKRLKEPAVVEEIDKYIITKDFDLSQMLIISNEVAEWEHKTVREIANLNDWSEGRALAEILQRNTEMWMVYHCIDEADIEKAILWPNAMICTDSWSHPINAPKRIGVPHPRSYGAFTQFIMDFVKGKSLISFEEAVRKVTSMPAQYFNLPGRGSIRVGAFADLVLFDFDKIEAKATYSSPCELSKGVEHLWVNGQMVISNGKINDALPGRIIRNVED